MKLEMERPTAWRVTLHPLELAALISAARWAATQAGEQLPPEAVEQLRQVLDSYDHAIAHS